MKPVKTGLIGCGNISSIYCQNAKQLAALDLVAAADLVMERAQSRCQEFDIPRAITVEEMLADPEIEAVINLTIPKAHAEVALRVLEAGKSVYNEKPLAISREDGRKMLAQAAQKGVRVGCAPDTFLGGGLQTCRKLIDDGWIGEPIAAVANMVCHGHEGWHPDPEFYYQVGGGPMFDMGPYYLTALINLLGPVSRVTGSARATFPTRTITSEPKYGTVVEVEVPTHVVGVLDFANGAIGAITMTFDVWSSNLPRLEVYGTQGSLSLPDPNTFGGPVRVRRAGASEWSEIPLTHGYAENARGVGVADLAMGIRSGRPHRANGELACHVLDIMHAVHEASLQGKHVTLETTCARPAPMVMGLLPWTLEE